MVRHLRRLASDDAEYVFPPGQAPRTMRGRFRRRTCRGASSSRWRTSSRPSPETAQGTCVEPRTELRPPSGRRPPIPPHSYRAADAMGRTRVARQEHQSRRLSSGRRRPAGTASRTPSSCSPRRFRARRAAIADARSRRITDYAPGPRIDAGLTHPSGSRANDLDTFTAQAFPSAAPETGPVLTASFHGVPAEHDGKNRRALLALLLLLLASIAFAAPAAAQTVRGRTSRMGVLHSRRHRAIAPSPRGSARRMGSARRRLPIRPASLALPLVSSPGRAVQTDVASGPGGTVAHRAGGGAGAHLRIGMRNTEEPTPATAGAQ